MVQISYLIKSTEQINSMRRLSVLSGQIKSKYGLRIKKIRILCIYNMWKLMSVPIPTCSLPNENRKI